MATLVKKLENGSIVEFDNGTFDSWCVYLKPIGKARFAPKDIHYFTELMELGRTYGAQRIYNDFIRFYQPTSMLVDAGLLEMITQLSKSYSDHRWAVDAWFTVIYAGMVAEENKQFAILKKRVKRLGMHQLLINGESPEYAANFSKGKNWRELDAIMRGYGF